MGEIMKNWQRPSYSAESMEALEKFLRNSTDDDLKEYLRTVESDISNERISHRRYKEGNLWFCGTYLKAKQIEHQCIRRELAGREVK